MMRRHSAGIEWRSDERNVLVSIRGVEERRVEKKNLFRRIDGPALHNVNAEVLSCRLRFFRASRAGYACTERRAARGSGDGKREEGLVHKFSKRHATPVVDESLFLLRTTSPRVAYQPLPNGFSLTLYTVTPNFRAPRLAGIAATRRFSAPSRFASTSLCSRSKSATCR